MSERTRRKAAAPPLTDKQIEAFGALRLSGRERRLLDTARAARRRCDELADQLRRLQEVHAMQQIDRDNDPDARRRCLIVAFPGEMIDVYADPDVSVQVTHVHEASGRDEERFAWEWAMRHATWSHRQLVHDMSVRPEMYSVRCLSRRSFRLLRIELGALELLKEIEKMASPKDSAAGTTLAAGEGATGQGAAPPRRQRTANSEPARRRGNDAAHPGAL